MLLCFASSGLLMAEERSFARTDFTVFAEKLITFKEKKKHTKHRRTIWKAVQPLHNIYNREKSAQYPEAAFCFLQHNEEERLWSSNASHSPWRGGKQSQGIWVGFSTQGDAEQKKMRWTVVRRKAENLQLLQNSWQETKLLKKVSETKQIAKSSLTHSVVSRLSRQEWKLSCQRKRIPRMDHQHQEQHWLKQYKMCENERTYNQFKTRN